MTINFKSKLSEAEQSLDLTNGLITFIGQNGCGKSSILEAIFQKYIEDETLKVICFSSGQNELFSSLFNHHKKINRRYLNEREESSINSFYFDANWVRMLVFWSTIFKPNGLVRKYLVEKNYIDIDDVLGDDISSKLDFRFRIRKYYVDKIKKEIEEEEHTDQEEEGYVFNEDQLRKTSFHETIEKIISTFNIDFDFSNNTNLVKRWLKFDSEKAYDVFTHKNINKIFTFWALATNGWTSNTELEECSLKFKNNLEFSSLSDGEYQLLSTYAILDLFDSENTIFLFDEIDSHLYYENIEKLWTVLKAASGKIIATTHISDSILQNEIESIKLIENGKIEADLTIIELSKRLSNIVGKNSYEFNVASRIKKIALIDDHVDWLIFRKLAFKKIGEQVNVIFNQIIPIKRTSSFKTTEEVFGKGKLRFVEDFKANAPSNSLTEDLFLICDKDDLPISQVNNDLRVRIHNEFKDVKKFKVAGVANATTCHLLSWKRREIENYLISPSMLNYFEKLQELEDQFRHITFPRNNNLDDFTDIRELDSKTLIHPLYKDGGFDEEKLDLMIEEIPVDEISNDIELMYNYLRDHI
ncbi:AAA family ATPase [Wenyingzhuangia aestuarii]|uniref:AAA family ATPase n=1 Tax=Wenyingzhuangia aestuarii TaxID=1647582 RepID=UPI00143C140E|nr:AAA family ATPase [Wenyingzhuangia aestuarii]NJB83584.1 ABC-type multidrug transport system ATPase subunit [Wenyingzhuangia aestuarii]